MMMVLASGFGAGKWRRCILAKSQFLPPPDDERILLTFENDGMVLLLICDLRMSSFEMSCNVCMSFRINVWTDENGSWFGTLIVKFTQEFAYERTSTQTGQAAEAKRMFS